MKLETNRSLTLLLDKIDARTRRERLLILVLGVAFFWALFYIGFFQPQKADLKTMIDTEDSIKKRIAGWEAEIASIAVAHKGASSTDIKRKKAELEDQLSLLNAKPKEVAAHVVPPQSMASLLEETLLGNKELRLINIQTLPVKPLFSEDQEKGNASGLFMHPLILVFEGSYFETLNYLRRIEQLRWRFFWDELEYLVTAYPTARITVKLHTLSEKASWLDV